MYKKIIGILVVMLMIGTTATALTELNQKRITAENFEEIVVEYNFEKPILQTINIGEKVYNRITSTNLDPAGKIGEPLVPSKGAYILLPPEAEITNIKINHLDKNTIKTTYPIEPMEKPKTLEELEEIHFPIPDEKVYTKNDFYPGELYTKSGMYHFRGYEILVLLLHPIQYNPVSGEIEYYKQFTVSVETTNSEQVSNLFRGTEKDERQVQTKIDNPLDAELYRQYQQQSSTNTDNYDLLVITTDELKEYFDLLKEDHDGRGILTEIKTLSDVGGSDSPEDIRDLIKNEYTTNGIEYVLLGGDADIIPAKMIYVTGMDEETWHVSTNMPVDLYYACLDGDGPNNDGGDLMAEVYVGRACVGSRTEFAKFYEKTITYMDKKRGVDSYLDKICLAGEYMQGNYGIASFSGNELDQLIDTCSEDGYTTTGFSSNEYSIQKLYDRDWPGFNKHDPYETGWQPEDVIDIIESGVHILPHSGHSWYNGYMKMHYTWISRGYIDNRDEPFFAWSTGCMAGGFDNPEGYDCVAEYFTAKSYDGAFAGIWNARSGFFWTFRLDSDSHRYNREFFDAVYGEKIYNIAKANHDSKEDNLHLIDRSCMRWVYFETNLFGDPTVTFHISYPPEKPNIPDGPTRGKAGEEHTFSTSSTDPEGEQLYYKWNWGEGNFSNWLGPFNSGEICEASYTWIEQNQYNITVKTKDIHGEESDWSDPLAISMPKNKAINTPFLNFLEQHPHLFPLLRQLLEL